MIMYTYGCDLHLCTYKYLYWLYYMLVGCELCILYSVRGCCIMTVSVACCQVLLGILLERKKFYFAFLHCNPPLFFKTCWLCQSWKCFYVPLNFFSERFKALCCRPEGREFEARNSGGGVDREGLFTTLVMCKGKNNLLWFIFGDVLGGLYCIEYHSLLPCFILFCTYFIDKFVPLLRID
jgi:hypothetical protein